MKFRRLLEKNELTPQIFDAINGHLASAGTAHELGRRTAVRADMKLQAESFWLATQAVDMRTGINGLSLHVQQALGRAPYGGTAYVFSNRRRTHLKLVCWDGNGVWMCLRRLHRGQFVWPQAHETSWQLTRAMAVADRRRRLATAGPARTSVMAAVVGI